MKSLTIFISCLITACIVNAQQVNYTVTHDNADTNPWLVVNLDLFQLDFFLNSLDGTSFNFGAWGHVQPLSPNWGGEYNFKRSWFTLGRIAAPEMPAHTELNLGGYFFFRSKLKTGKRTKVVLNSETKDVLYQPGTQVSTTTFIMVPGQRKRFLGVHGGFYRKSHGFGFDKIGEDYIDFPYEYGSFASTAIYGGLLSRSFINLFIDTDTHGTCFNSIGNDVYADVIISVSNNFKSLEGENINSTIKPEFEGEGPLGFRVGWKRYQIEQKALTGKRFGMSANFEVGYKPFLGWFVNGGIGITLIKAKK